MPRRRTRQRYQMPQRPPRADGLTTPQRLARWQSRAAQGVELRQQWEQRFHVRELEELYLGTQDMESADEQWYNHFFATVRVQMPSLFYQNPSFRVRPVRGRTPFGKRDAAIAEALLQQIAAEDDNLATDGKLALLQAFFRLGCLKACYYPQMEPNPQAGEPMTEALQGHRIPLLGDDGEPTLEPTMVLDDETYSWDWVDAHRLILPDEGPDHRKWTWIIEEIELTLDEAKDETRFPENLRRQFCPNASAGQEFDILTPGKSDPYDPQLIEGQDLLRFRYYEGWDMRQKRLYVWAMGQPFSGEEFILDEPYPDGIEEHPYSLLRFLPIVGPKPSPWPIPYVYNWAPLQRDYNAARRQLTNAGNRAARKILYDPQTFPDSEEARKFLSSSVDMEAVQVQDITRPPLMFGEASLNVDVTRSTQALLYDWRIITGSTGERLGASERGDKTATEATLSERSSSMRENDLQNLVATWLARAGSQMLQLVRQTMTLDMYVTMRGMSDSEFTSLLQSPGFQQLLAQQYGPEAAQQFPQMLEVMPGLAERFKQQFGSEQFLRVSREQLQWDADVSVQPASLKIRTLDAERQAWLQFLGLLGQFPLILQSRALLEETAEKFEFLNEGAIDELWMVGQHAQQAQAQAQQMQMEMQSQKAATGRLKLATDRQKAEGEARVRGILPLRGSTPNGQLPPMSRGVL